MHRRIGWSLLTVLAALAVSALAGVTAGTAAASSSRVRVGSAAVLTRGARVIGTTPSGTPLHMTVALQPQNSAGLSALATEVSTPGTALFRHYLTVSQFAQRFGATPLQIGAVESALRAQGLSVGTVTANDLTIPVTGTAAQVEKAFSVTLAQVKLPSGRTAFANEQAPALPAGIAGYVQGVIGLDNVVLPQPVSAPQPLSPRALRDPSIRRDSGPIATQAVKPHVLTGGPQPCAAAQQEQGTFESSIFNQFSVNAFPVTADQVATAYSLPSMYLAGDLGAGQTIAVFEQQPYNPADIGIYQGCYGTSTSVSNVDIDGGPGPYVAPPGGAGDGESALDIEEVIGIAPRASILVYEGPPSPNATVDILSAIVSQNRAREISSSFGTCESLTGGSTLSSENTLLSEAALQGQSFFASSGDSGAETCSQQGTQNFSLSVEDPSAQPFATGVGGTSLTATGPPPSEGVWNDGPNPECQCSQDTIGGGSGGGLSIQWPMPSYQSSAAPALKVINPDSSSAPCGAATNCREDPDVSADGDLLTGYVMEFDGSWNVVGGTSASTPLWAAYTALVNASGPCRGLPIGFANPALYQIAGSSYLNNFNDIAAASPYTRATTNDTLEQFGVSITTDPNNLFPVGPGYDMATGLGSPIGAHLAAALCALRAPVFSVVVANPGTQTARVRQHVALQIHAADSGGAHLSFNATGLPAGLGINAANGIISGTPAFPGTSIVTVFAGDSFANGGATAFKFVVVKPGAPKFSHDSLGGLTKGKPKLTFTIGAGASAAALKSLVLSLPSGLSFSKSSKSLSKGIVIKGSNGKKLKFKARGGHGKLAITLSTAVGKATITISRPAISVSSSLASKVRHGKLKKLSIGLQAVDSSHNTTKLTLRLKV